MEKSNSNREVNSFGIKKLNSLKLVHLYNVGRKAGIPQEELNQLYQTVSLGVESLFKEVPAKYGKDFEQANLKLRHLVEAGVDWKKLESAAWRLLELSPTAKIAARVAEVVLLRGTQENIIEVFTSLCRKELRFYENLQPSLRNYALLRLWLGKSFGVIGQLINERTRDLLPLEHLLFFWQFVHQEPKKAFLYYQNNEKLLKKAVTEFGSKLNISLGRLYLLVGSAAVKLDYDVHARTVLKKIKPSQPEYQEALDLLLKLKVSLDENGNSIYVAKLLAQKHWRDRIKLFYEFFSNSRRLGGVKDQLRGALNDLLKEPLRWVPESPEAWSQMSTMLVDNSNLEQLLPQVFTLFKGMATKFHSPKMDIALWAPVLDLKLPNSSMEKYWQGVAFLHLFVAGYERGEEMVFHALEMVQNAKKNSHTALPIEWQVLHRQASNWVAKTPSLLEHVRSRLLAQLRIVSDIENLAMSDVKSYLSLVDFPPYNVLNRLYDIAHQKRCSPIEMMILQKQAEATHYTNSNLDQLWRLACNTNSHDLAWRVITVLNTRKKLHPMIIHPWAISGEKRAEYSLMIPSYDILKLALRDLKGDEIKFAKAILRVGPFIPELLSLLDKDATVIKRPSYASGTYEDHVDQVLEKINWCGKSKKFYRFSYDNPGNVGYKVPPFIQVLPNNIFSHLVVRLADRLGISSWNWSVSRLKTVLSELITDLAVVNQARHSNRVGKWLKKMNAEERNSWYDLGTISNRISDDRAFVILWKIVLRLAVLINQNHYQALSSLKTMRIPVSIIWDLEIWLLSAQYNKIRQMMNTKTKVVVPLSLQRLESLQYDIDSMKDS